MSQCVAPRASFLALNQWYRRRQDIFELTEWMNSPPDNDAARHFTAQMQHLLSEWQSHILSQKPKSAYVRIQQRLEVVPSRDQKQSLGSLDKGQDEKSTACTHLCSYELLAELPAMLSLVMHQEQVASCTQKRKLDDVETSELNPGSKRQKTDVDNWEEIRTFESVPPPQKWWVLPCMLAILWYQRHLSGQANAMAWRVATLFRDLLLTFPGIIAILWLEADMWHAVAFLRQWDAQLPLHVPSFWNLLTPGYLDSFAPPEDSKDEKTSFAREVKTDQRVQVWGRALLFASAYLIITPPFPLERFVQSSGFTFRHLHANFDILDMLPTFPSVCNELFRSMFNGVANENCTSDKQSVHNLSKRKKGNLPLDSKSLMSEIVCQALALRSCGAASNTEAVDDFRIKVAHMAAENKWISGKHARAFIGLARIHSLKHDASIRQYAVDLTRDSNTNLAVRQTPITFLRPIRFDFTITDNQKYEECHCFAFPYILENVIVYIRLQLQESSIDEQPSTNILINFKQLVDFEKDKISGPEDPLDHERNLKYSAGGKVVREVTVHIYNDNNELSIQSIRTETPWKRTVDIVKHANASQLAFLIVPICVTGR